MMNIISSFNKDVDDFPFVDVNFLSFVQLTACTTDYDSTPRVAAGRRDEFRKFDDDHDDAMIVVSVVSLEMNSNRKLIGCRSERDGKL